MVPYVNSLIGDRERPNRMATLGLSLTLLGALLWSSFAHANSFQSAGEAVVAPEKSLTFANSVPPPAQDYVLWYRNYYSPAIYALVELALEKTPEYGDYRLLRS